MTVFEQLQEAVPAALDELTKKSYLDIQMETSVKWAARAIACFTHSVQASTAGLGLGSYEMGCEFSAKALEHAAMLENAEFLLQVSAEICKAKGDAYSALVSDEIQEDEESPPAPEQETSAPEEVKIEEHTEEKANEEKQD